jgi:hypothetical protein
MRGLFVCQQKPPQSWKAKAGWAGRKICWKGDSVETTQPRSLAIRLTSAKTIIPHGANVLPVAYGEHRGCTGLASDSYHQRHHKQPGMASARALVDTRTSALIAPPRQISLVQVSTMSDAATSGRAHKKHQVGQEGKVGGLQQGNGFECQVIPGSPASPNATDISV